MTSKFVEQTVRNRLVLDTEPRKTHVIFKIFWIVPFSGQLWGNKPVFWGAKIGGAT